MLGDDKMINLAPGVGLAQGEVVRGAGWRRPVNVASRDQAHLAHFDQSDDNADGESDKHESNEAGISNLTKMGSSC